MIEDRRNLAGRSRNQGLVIGLVVATAVLVIGGMLFMLAGPGRGPGASQTNVNVTGSGQQPPGGEQLNINLTVRPQPTALPQATAAASATARPTSTTAPTATPQPSATATPSPSPSPTGTPTR